MNDESCLLFLASSVTLPSTTRTVMGVSGLWETKNGDGSTLRINPGAAVVLGLAWLMGWLYASLAPQFAESATNLISTNDLYLHRYIVNYIARNFNSISIYIFLAFEYGFSAA